MKGKIKTTLLIAVLLISTITIAIPVSAVKNVYVDGSWTGAESGTLAEPYNTIGEAITAAAAGDTIIVAAGNYAERLVTGAGDTGLTLLGPNADIDPNTGTRVAEAIIDTTGLVASGQDAVDPNADGLIINGFTITGDDPGSGHQWGIGNAADAYDDVEIKYNIISGYMFAIGETGRSGWIISNNLIDALGGNAVHLAGGSDHIVRDNTVTGGSVYPHSNAANTLIEDNILTNPDGTAIMLVTTNKFTVTGNTIKDSVRGIKIYNVPHAESVINYNDIYDNVDYGIVKDGSGTVNAELNWWGAASGPSTTGAGDNYDGLVDYAKWLPASMDFYADEAAALAAAVDSTPELFKTYYQIDDIVTVTVYDGMVGIRPAVADTIEVDVSSDYPDAIEVELTETGINTGVYDGSFTVVDATPGATELLVVDGSLVTVTYSGLSETVIIDMLDPVVGTVVPAKDSRIYSDVPTISAVLTDDGSGLASVTLKLDGTVVALKTFSLPTALHTILYKVQAFEALSEGLHTVEVTASDVAGNTATETWSFTVDLTKPTVSVLVKPDPAKETLVTFTLTFNEDMDTTLDPTVKFGKTSPYTSYTVTKLDTGWVTDSLRVWKGTATPPTTIDGLNTISISLAKDIAGTVMVTETSNTFTIDTVAPTAPADLTATDTDVSVTLTWTASTDLGTGLKAYEIYRGGSKIDSVLPTITTYTDFGPLAKETYTYFVKAVDLALNEANSDSESVAFVPGDVIAYPVELEEGWNLISLPLVPEDADIEVVLADVLENVETVHGYEAGGWLNYIAAAPEFATLTDIEDGNGYWVKMTADDTLIVYGTKQPVFEPPRVYDVYDGWNLIAFKSTTEETVSDYLTTIPETLTDYMVIYSWDATDQAYELLCAGTPIVEKFSPGEGYWLYLIGDAVIVPIE